MNLLVKLFSFKGRISRGTFLRLSLLNGSLLLVFAFSFISTGSDAFNGDGDLLQSSLFVVSMAGLLLVGTNAASLMYRRLQDMDITPYKQVGIILFSSLIVILIKLLIDKSLYTDFSSSAKLTVIVTMFFIGLVFMFGVKGTTGPNRYGEDPLDNSAVK